MQVDSQFSCALLQLHIESLNQVVHKCILYVLLWGIVNLSVNADVAKVVSMEGGIIIFIALSKSPNRWVAEEATGECQAYF